MLSGVEHRRPDGNGLWYDPQVGVGIGHARLSIIDLSDRASQPMLSRDGRYVISFNGEIYNYRELRKELERSARFASESDTEVLLQAYATWGSHAVTRLNGIFAFAIWDTREREFFVARDHLGVNRFTTLPCQRDFCLAPN